jgi:hypothetical protein
MGARLGDRGKLDFLLPAPALTVACGLTISTKSITTVWGNFSKGTADSTAVAPLDLDLMETKGKPRNSPIDRAYALCRCLPRRLARGDQPIAAGLFAFLRGSHACCRSQRRR